MAELEEIREEDKDRGIFFVNALGIVYNKKLKKILITRRENDPYVKELTWCFPGGRPAYEENLEHYLKEEIKKKTNIDVEVKEIIFARRPPEKSNFLLLYYNCTTDQEKIKAGEKAVEAKWVNPTEVRKYFTTSIDPKIINILEKLESRDA